MLVLRPAEPKPRIQVKRRGLKLCVSSTNPPHSTTFDAVPLNSIVEDVRLAIHIVAAMRLKRKMIRLRDIQVDPRLIRLVVVDRRIARKEVVLAIRLGRRIRCSSAAESAPGSSPAPRDRSSEGAPVFVTAVDVHVELVTRQLFAIAVRVTAVVLLSVRRYRGCRAGWTRSRCQAAERSLRVRSAAVGTLVIVVAGADPL